MGSRNIRMFLEPELQNTNKNNLVAPTGFEPVFGLGHVFASDIAFFCFRTQGQTPHDSNMHSKLSNASLEPSLQNAANREISCTSAPDRPAMGPVPMPRA